MNINEENLVNSTVTCRTPGCANENIPITLLCGEIVICGPCEQQITDVEVVTDGRET